MSETQTPDEQARSPLRRRMAIAFGVVTACLIAAYFIMVRLDYEVLYSDLDIADASMIAAELDRQETRYRVGDEGGTILVNKRHVDDIRLALYAADGPAQGLTGFELFNESEMGLTDFAQRIKFQRAIQGELGRTIMMMDGVKKARVHVAIPERSVFRNQSTHPKAAISIIFEEGVQWADDNIIGIQRLVASSIPGLALQHVTVIDGQGQIISRASEILDYDDALASSDYTAAARRVQDPVATGVVRVAALPLETGFDAAPVTTPDIVMVDTQEALPEPAAASVSEADVAPAEIDRTVRDALATPDMESRNPVEPAREIRTTANVEGPSSEGVSLFDGEGQNQSLPAFWALGIACLLLLFLLVGGVSLYRQFAHRSDVEDYDAFSVELSRALQTRDLNHQDEEQSYA